MAARALLQRRAAPLAASMLVGAVAFSPKLALAEAPESHNSHSRKPIYDDFDAVPTTATLPPAKTAVRPDTSSSTTTLAPESPASPSLTEVAHPQQYQRHGPTPTDRLAAQIRDVRLFIYRHACTAEDAVNRTMDRAFHLEKSFTDTIASLAPPPESGEKPMPGLVYVLVAAMAGSIVTRRSNILLRATVPVAFGVGMGWTAIPHTMRNTSDLAWKYEQRYPVVAQGHLQIKDSWRQGVSFARVHTQLGRDKLEEKVKGARETVEEWVRKGK